MPTTTVHPLYSEYYVVNGESMATYGWGIESITTGLPERKGENVTSPIMHGNIFREKRFGGRTDTWNIWVCDADPTTGAIPATENGKRAQFNANMDYVNRILNGLTPSGLNNGSLQITKTYLTGTGPSGPTTASLTAYGEVAAAYSYEDAKQFNYALLSVEVFYPNPLWFDQSTTIKTLDGSPSEPSITVSMNEIGNAPVTSLVIEITPKSGETVTNPIVSNTSLTDYPISIGFIGTLTSGQTVTIDTSNYTVYKNTSIAIASLYRSGYRQDWFELYPTMDNTVTGLSVSGEFDISLTYKKAYF